MINTILIDMPIRIKAYTVRNKDGSYTIVLNSRLCSEQNIKSYKHELFHIQNGDYDGDCKNSDLLEIFAHRI